MPMTHSSSRGALVASVQERACHVQVHDDEEERCADGVHGAGCSQPYGTSRTHVLTEFEGGRLARLEVHGDEDARHDLHDEHQQRQRTEEVPDVEILRRVVARQLVGHELVDRQALVEPGAKPAGALFHRGGHQATPFAGASTPMTSLLSPSKLYGGTLQVHRGRRALEHAPGKIELRTMAGAEESARPVRHDRGVTRREARLRQASKMRAGADEHQHFGLDRARVVLRVFAADPTPRTSGP